MRIFINGSNTYGWEVDVCSFIAKPVQVVKVVLDEGVGSAEVCDERHLKRIHLGQMW